MSKKG